MGRIRDPRAYDAAVNSRNRRIERYWEKNSCVHDWEHKPNDFFFWHCKKCDAWSNMKKPHKKSHKGHVFRCNYKLQTILDSTNNPA